MQESTFAFRTFFAFLKFFVVFYALELESWLKAKRVKIKIKEHIINSR